jgi:hypothetical protein
MHHKNGKFDRYRTDAETRHTLLGFPSIRGRIIVPLMTT